MSAVPTRALIAAEIRSARLARAEETSTIPLDELKATYQGRDGGLYGEGRNEPDGALAIAAENAASQVLPLNSRGNPAADGKIGILAIGQSTTRIIFDAFRLSARKVKSPNVVLVNGAIDGNGSDDWANRSGPWSSAVRQVNRSGLNSSQVQVLWFETTLIFPKRFGNFEASNAVYVRHLNAIVNRATKQFPNLRQIFVSSRYYGGWAKKPTSPEPYAYESAFGVRDLVLSRVPDSADSAWPRVAKPVVLWGPYYWTDGTHPSKVDGLNLTRGDLKDDGVHPTKSGEAKFADQLIRFFSDNRYTQNWFTGVSPNA
ncbi:hypothetical protein GC170_22010 [bacterium]|nr:hypothetical protein [bacterium]